MATLGNSTQPSGVSSPSAGSLYLQRVQAAANGTLDSIEVWLSAGNASWAERIFCIYSDNTGSPNTLIAQSSAFFGPPDFTMAQFTRSVSASLTAGTYYWIGVQFEHDSSQIASEIASGFTGYRNYSAVFGSLPTTLSGGTTDANTRYGISGTTSSSATPTIDTYPAEVRSGQTGIAYTTTGLSSVSSIAIGSLAATAISDTSGDGTHSIPSLTDETAHELFGTKTITISGTGGNPTVSRNFLPPTGHVYATLGNDIDSSTNGIVHNFSPAAVENDQIVTPSALTPNDRGQASGEAGTYLCWHIQASTKIARSYQVILGDPTITNIKGTGGITSTGAAKSSISKSVKASGSVTLSGNVKNSLVKAIKATGVIVSSGIARITRLAKTYTSGSITLNGSGRAYSLAGAITHTVYAVGGILASGASAIKKLAVFKAVGGLVSDGLAKVGLGKSIKASGNTSVSGGALVSFTVGSSTYSAKGSGGGILSGKGIMSFVKRIFGGGSISVSGAAISTSSLDYDVPKTRILGETLTGTEFFRDLRKRVYTFKDPDSNIDYARDFSVKLKEMDDTISTATIITAGGISYTRLTFDDYTVSAFFSGGSVGTLGSATFRIVTEGGRTLDRTLNFIIRQE